jgi:hypothetical protein
MRFGIPHSCHETKINDGHNAGIVSNPSLFACLLAKITGHSIVAEPPRKENQPVQDLRSSQKSII